MSNEEILRAALLEILAIVLHPASAQGQGKVLEIDRIIRQALEDAPEEPEE